MTDEEVRQLKDENVGQIDLMDVDAGTVIKTLLSELQREGRDTYIRLKNAARRGHTVEYEFVEGDLNKVASYGHRLGVEVTGSTLEVPSE